MKLFLVGVRLKRYMVEPSFRWFGELNQGLANLIGKISLAALLFTGLSHGQTFSHADSGWVKIFNGTDFTGIYSRVWGGNATIQHPPGAPFEIVYPGTDTACIRVNGTTPGGNVGTDKTSYSHYRVRVDQKFDQLAPDNNGGLTYHTDETVSRMLSNWPRSIEFQMQQKEPGAAYSIQQVTFTTTVSGNHYAATGGQTVQVCENGCNARNYTSNPIPAEAENGKPRWLRFELVVRGADSAIHIINDTVVFKLWNIRIFNDVANKTPNGPYDHGGFGLQSEGASMNYRHWEVMEFPPATPYTGHYLHRLFLDNVAAGETLKSGSVYPIKWRTLGLSDIAKVSLQYNTGTGWQPITTDSVSNTGTYNWTVPNLSTQTLRVRVAGPAWAWADSSKGFSSISPASGVRPEFKNPVTFSVQGKGEIFANVNAFQSLEIRNVFGQLVRTFAIGGQNLKWDLADQNGHAVQPGIYFVRLLAPGLTQTTRILIQ